MPAACQGNEKGGRRRRWCINKYAAGTSCTAVTRITKKNPPAAAAAVAANSYEGPEWNEPFESADPLHRTSSSYHSSNNKKKNISLGFYQSKRDGGNIEWGEETGRSGRITQNEGRLDAYDGEEKRIPQTSDVNSLLLTTGRTEKAVVRFLLLCSQTGLRSAGKNNPIKICFSRNQQTDREEAAGKVLGTATVLLNYCMRRWGESCNNSVNLVVKKSVERACLFQHIFFLEMVFDNIQLQQL